ncbi:BEN domain-containing protein 6-like [Gadus macrocephalus]|uniref:BEN domain-containing protein 6-like n=1 Tax=Gadus macrocephalus TaxID=80720 RepID=UPI0028CBBEDE|nr:BEN domain-containing protein 6-like [Gadus macrocephalus]
MELEKQGSCQLNSINETRNECHHPSCELLRENNHRLQRENDSLKAKIATMKLLPDVLQKMEEFLRSAPRPTTTPIPTPTPRPRPEPTLSPAPTAVPPPATEDPSPAPGPSSASATEALGHSVIPKGLVERCSFQSPQKFINDLLHGMYTREYMAGHSVTGQSSSSCTEGKPGLAKQDLVEITNAAKLKFTYVTDTNIKAFIRQKLNNAAKFQKQ